MVVFFVPLIVAFAASSQESSGGEAISDEQMQQIKQKARSRQYLGGRDEEPLRVQPQLVTPARKIIPSSSNEESEPASHD